VLFGLYNNGKTKMSGRNLIIGVRFTKTERLKIQVEAERLGMSISAFIRLLLKKKKAI